MKETIGRVHLVNKTNYVVKLNDKELDAVLSGRFYYQAISKSDYPVVGDYVQVRGEDTLIIERVMERRNTLDRVYVNKKAEKQVLASNIDIIFICMSMNHDFNMKKLQNFITLTYNTNAEVIVLLTKKDLKENNDYYIRQVTSAYDYQVMPISIFDQGSIMRITQAIGHKTAVLIGSSGVGKSSLMNQIIGEKHFDVKDIRESDAQGRHTTSHRELVELESGGAIIDTPGIRIVMSHLTDDIDDKFDQVNELSKTCRFNDCSHVNEPGCAVLEAIDDGVLSVDKYEVFLKMRKYDKFLQNRAKQKTRQMQKKSHQ